MIKIIRFTSPNCGPCRAMAPNWDTIKSKYQNEIEFVDVDVSKDVELAKKLNVLAVPTLCLMDEYGRETDRAIGFQTYNQLEDFCGGRNLQSDLFSEQSHTKTA